MGRWIMTNGKKCKRILVRQSAPSTNKERERESVCVCLSERKSDRYFLIGEREDRDRCFGAEF